MSTVSAWVSMQGCRFSTHTDAYSLYTPYHLRCHRVQVLPYGLQCPSSV